MMNITAVLLLPLALVFCSGISEAPPENRIIKTEFQSYIDSANVKGAILIHDLKRGRCFSNDFDWAQRGHLPASTFKIPNSIIALECGVVNDDSTLFQWDGRKRSVQAWEQDLIFMEAFHYSCVPCYQEVARKIGARRMRDYLDKFEYGNMDVHPDNINVFWLEGASRISQLQQIDFLKRFYQSQLPIAARTEKIAKRMMVIEQNKHYRLSGKTGWSVQNGQDNGWFVGYVETSDNVYFFATNVEPKEPLDMKSFPETRKDVTYRALKHLKIL